MLYLRKALCIFLMALLLVQPVFAETEAVTDPTEPVEPDIVTAVHTVQTLPGNWSPLSPETAEKQWLRDLTTAPLYAMASDGSWEPILAKALPDDVTADYAGTYGIPADARRGYAFRILLNSDARWEDGLLITAGDYLFSIQKLLENEEHRQNWLFLANAEAILSGEEKQGSHIISLEDAGFSGVSEAWSAGYTDFYVDTDGFWGLDSGWKSVSDRNRVRDYAMPDGLDEYFVTPAYLYNRYLLDGTENSHYQSEFVGICQPSGEVLTMDDLGVIKVSNFELVLISQEPAAPSTLMQKLEKLFLFRESYWDKDFATSPETYCGYGPYRITSADTEQITLETNPNWWGAADPRGYDRIICQKIGA